MSYIDHIVLDEVTGDDEWDESDFDEWDDDDYDFDLPDDEAGYVDRTVPICEDCGEHDWPWAGCRCDDEEESK